MQLSKSEYMMFLRQPAWLWLKKHRKKILPAPDANLQAIFDAGNLFEDYAEKIFPDAVSLGFDSYQEYLTLPARTTTAIENGAETLFQGRFEAENITCIIDVLKRVNGNIFDLYEIKSTSQVKKEHAADLAFQTIVLEKSGLEIQNIYVTHVNSDYVRDGEINVKDLTTTEDVTDTVRAVIDETKQGIKEAFAVIASEEIPDISPRYADLGSLKEWMVVYQLLTEKVDPYSIFGLCRLTAKKIGEFEDLDVEMIEDIPEDCKLSEHQERQVNATQTNRRHIDTEQIKGFLDKWKYPLYFFDYETLSGVIPAFDGIKPRQQVPFQYSLHILDSPEGELVHKEYLHTENTHPGKPLIERLQSDFGDTGSIIVWNQSFEKSCNVGLGDMFSEDQAFLESFNERIVDLMLPFSKGWFVDKAFFGSASIKNVLPVLVPSLSYKNLEIQEGGSAARLWMDAVLHGKNAEEKEKLMENLLKYCELDTLAMVEIWKVLDAIVHPKPNTQPLAVQQGSLF